MDLHGSGELQVDSRGVNNALNGEGANKPRGHIFWKTTKRTVQGRKGEWHVYGGWLTVGFWRKSGGEQSEFPSKLLSVRRRESAVGTWMIGETGAVDPLQNLGTDRVGDKLTVRRTVTWVWMEFLISQVREPTTQLWGRIVSAEVTGPSEENNLDRASGLVFLEPGRYVSVKLKWPKKRAHLTCREFSLTHLPLPQTACLGLAG